MNRVYIKETATVAGKKEQDILGKYFDVAMPNDAYDEKAWELAESRMQNEAIKTLLLKSATLAQDVDLILAGDLLAQDAASSFGLREFGIPLLGQYGACSTMAQTLLLGYLLINSGYINNAICGTSSNFYSAERQFRVPIEYGAFRSPTAQWTATGSGFALVDKEEGEVAISDCMIGRIIDLGVKDVSQMGAAMAPAAADTIARFLNGKNLNDYTMIVTGDLGTVGSEVLIDLLKTDSGIDISDLHMDCGNMLYDTSLEDYRAGGSGCGCSALVLCGYIFDMMKKKQFEKILFIGTGALLSATSSLQGESVPAIAHLVELTI